MAVRPPSFVDICTPVTYKKLSIPHLNHAPSLPRVCKLSCITHPRPFPPSSCTELRALLDPIATQAARHIAQCLAQCRAAAGASLFARCPSARVSAFPGITSAGGSREGSIGTASCVKGTASCSLQPLSADARPRTLAPAVLVPDSRTMPTPRPTRAPLLLSLATPHPTARASRLGSLPAEILHVQDLAPSNVSSYHYVRRLKDARAAKQEQALLEVENAEDDLVQKTEVAIALMEKYLNELAKAQLIYFAHAAETLLNTQAELEELSSVADEQGRWTSSLSGWWE
ncbi:hypothetical protein DFH08DRAFT_960130 [Mycena albidolilacea]|uniref:Uncharacterized protein n=1 Tax=Mycena albidolilacea TaxID=1033008 RepID=A0AAD7A1M5_9AGAR|nr:hypothetical protein DFH08DRAFT_960130 [Mycena albidolilacea]